MGIMSTDDRLSQGRVYEIYEDLARARLDRFAEALDERVDFLSHAPPELFPYLGRRRGRADVIDALTEMHRMLEVLSFWPLTVLLEGNKVALTVSINVRERSTGRSASFLGAHFLRFGEGRIYEFC